MQQAQFPLPQPPIQRPAGGGKAALLYGLIFGGAVSLLDILYTILVDNGTLTWYYSLVANLERLPYVLYYTMSGIVIGLPVYILLVIAFFLAGLLAARSARGAAVGVLASLFAGVIFLILDLFVATLLITFLIIIFPERSSMSAGSLINSYLPILLNSVIYNLIIDIILLGLGTLLGFLGGLVGNSGHSPTPPVQPYAYPGQPPAYARPQAQPGQPLPPTQPVQPGQSLPPEQPGQPSSPPQNTP